MSNPSRGCGTKTENSFYLEGTVSGNGNLSAWTWVLGDGLDDVLLIDFPPRGIRVINPAATIHSGEQYLATDFYRPVDEEGYAKVLAGTTEYGIGDHVGKKFYTAVQFARETGIHGPSRKVTKKQAMIMATVIAQLKKAKKFPCLPILFTHSRVPLFRSTDERERAYELAIESLSSFDMEWRRNAHWEACWRRPNWGMYARKYQYPGTSSKLIAVLNLLHKLESNEWKFLREDPEWDKYREFFDGLIYEEQAIGLSWITRVTYTLPKDGKIDPALLKVPGINFMNLVTEPKV